MSDATTGHVRGDTFAALVVIALVVCAGLIPVADERTDVAFVNGRVLTMDAEDRVAEALLVRDGRIAVIGSDEAVRARASASARVIDLGGQALLPGFIDAHGHFPMSGLTALGVDLRPPPIGEIGSHEALLERIASVVATDASGGWLLGLNYDNTAFADGQHPTRAALDRVSGERPVYLWHGSGHMGVANSRALAMLGIDEESEPVPGGARARDGVTGRLNGLLQERAAPSLARLLAEFPPWRLPRVLRRARDSYLAAGVTTVQNGHADARVARALRWTQRLGLLPQRLVVWLSAESMGRALLDERAGGLGVESSGDDFRIGAIKLVADGSPQGLTAWLSRPYAPTAGKPAGYAGFPAVPPDALRRTILSLHAMGRQLAIHGNGDAAIETIIDAVEAAQRLHPRDDPRHVLVHAQTVRRDQLERLPGLGLIPSFFVGHVYYWGDWHRERGLGERRATNISPTGWARELGLRYTLHADTPVTPMRPLEMMRIATERLTSSGVSLGPEQRLSRREALRAITIEAAWQSGLERAVGSLEVGKRADLVVLSEDPLRAPELWRVAVTSTWVDGIERHGGLDPARRRVSRRVGSATASRALRRWSEPPS